MSVDAYLHYHLSSVPFEDHSSVMRSLACIGLDFINQLSKNKQNIQQASHNLAYKIALKHHANTQISLRPNSQDQNLEKKNNHQQNLNNEFEKPIEKQIEKYVEKPLQQEKSNQDLQIQITNLSGSYQEKDSQVYRKKLSDLNMSIQKRLGEIEQKQNSLQNSYNPLTSGFASPQRQSPRYDQSKRIQTPVHDHNFKSNFLKFRDFKTSDLSQSITVNSPREKNSIDTSIKERTEPIQSMDRYLRNESYQKYIEQSLSNKKETFQRLESVNSPKQSFQSSFMRSIVIFQIQENKYTFH